MKKLFYLLMCMPLAFAACVPPTEEPTPEPQPEEKKPQLILTSNEVMNFKAEGGNGTIEYMLVNAKEGTEFTAEYEAEWISDFNYGETITFTVAENTDQAAREAKVTIKYDVASMEVTVKQAGKKATPAIVITSGETMEFGQDEVVGTIEYTIENPIQGIEITAEANVSWISQVTVKTDTIVFQVAANKGEAREGVITLTYGMLEANVTVKQAKYVAPAPVINLATNNLELTFEGGAQSIAYTIENPVEGAQLVAECDTEWISALTVTAEAITFDVAKNDGSGMRSSAISLAYGEVTANIVVSQLPENTSSDVTYSTFTVVETFAELENGGKQWDVFFVEHDDTLGDMQTLISFNMAENNTRCLTDGTYSVANGGILLNTATHNGYSSYRANSSLRADISDAEFVVKVDTTREVISFSGSFTVGNQVISLSYRGAMRGMDLTEASDEPLHFTEWKRVDKKVQNNEEFMFEARSKDGSLVLLVDIFHTPSSDKICPEGRYEVADYNVMENFVTNGCNMTLNSVKGYLRSGYVDCKHISGGYEFTFDLTDEYGRNITGVISGPVQYGINPA